ncbi:MAG: ParA family protein [Planctomycetota bacterium]
MKTIAFFNIKGDVGKTSLVYHLACMYSDLGLTVIAADLDPQANLTTMFMDEDRFDGLWPPAETAHTILGSILPLLEGRGWHRGALHRRRQKRSALGWRPWSFEF